MSVIKIWYNLGFSRSHVLCDSFMLLKVCTLFAVVVYLFISRPFLLFHSLLFNLPYILLLIPFGLLTSTTICEKLLRE